MKIPLFDIDWTILGKNKTRNIHTEAFLYTFEHIYMIKKPVTRELEGKIDNQIILETVMNHRVPRGTAEKKLPLAVETIKDYFAAHQHEGTLDLLPGVRTLLEELQSLKIPVGLLTGNIDVIGWRKLDTAGIKTFFSFGAFGNEAFRRPDLIEIAHKRAEKTTGTKIKRENFVIIGDTPLDIACAKQGGICSIGVATNPKIKKEDLDKAGADLAVNSLSEKEKILQFLSV
jgi:phosphoglycolate phosphatase-like HAD superfamily hydrolase